MALTEALADAIATANRAPQARQALAAALRSAVQELETPQENFWRMTMAPHQLAVVRSAIELHLFERLLDGPRTATELAESTGANLLLLIRFMRVLSATGMVKEVGVQKYEIAAGGRALAQNPGVKGAVSFMYGLHLNGRNLE